MTILLLALALAMGTAGVALAGGAIARPDAARIALAFGVAQAIMSLAGGLLGMAFAGPIDPVGHWVAFVLLGAIGARMVRRGRSRDVHYPASVPRPAFSGRPLMFPAIATSIDAAVVGVTLPTLGVPVLPAMTAIGGMTAALCLAGTLVGGRIGDGIGRAAGIGGGTMLIGIGANILIEHMRLIG